MPVAPAGYDPETLVPFSYHWADGHDIAIYVDASNPPPDADLAAAVQSAIHEWMVVGRLGEVRMHTVGDVHDADVIVHFTTTPRLVISDCVQSATLERPVTRSSVSRTIRHAGTFQFSLAATSATSRWMWPFRARPCPTPPRFGRS